LAVPQKRTGTYAVFFGMPRFYFHFKEDGYTHVDDAGRELPGLEEAEGKATVTAASLLRDAAAEGNYDNICLEVTNAVGFAVLTVCASIRVERKS
jgi:hypothetical protein